MSFVLAWRGRPLLCIPHENAYCIRHAPQRTYFVAHLAQFRTTLHCNSSHLLTFCRHQIDVRKVTAGALGMACGPALAAFLSRLAFPPQSTLWTVETAPGWIMLFLWSLFLIALVVFFEEPDRSHIFGSKKPKVELTSKLAANNGEDKFLLADMPSPEELELTREPPLWKNVPVMVTLWVYFILKLVLEALMSSSPTMTGYYFGWVRYGAPRISTHNPRCANYGYSHELLGGV